MSQISGVIQHLRRTVLRQEAAGRTDGQLLEDYLSRRDETACAGLVQRYGRMVWGVCRRLLPNEQDAEDAFQATFLVLIRRAASIVPRDRVANWLYGVAHQTALKARADAARRKGRERQVTQMPEPDVARQDPWCDLQPVLDEELSRLPDRFRLVIVLCELEGKSRKEAARLLGRPPGTIAGWLARARTMLAKRLARRGVMLSGGALAGVLAQNVASASVPAAVVSATIKATTLFAAGQVAVSVKVAALTEGVLKAMILSRLKSVSAVLGLLVVFALGTGALLHQLQAGALGPRLKGHPPLGQAGDRPRAEPKPIVVPADAAVHRLAWSPTGKLVAAVELTYDVVEFPDRSGGTLVSNSTVTLRDARTGKLHRSLGEQKLSYIIALAFSPDGKTLAISSSEQPVDRKAGKVEVRVVDAEDGTLKHKVDAAGFASALAFSPDGTRLALGGRSRHAAKGSFVKLWDVRRGAVIGGTEEHKEPQLPPGRGGRVTCLAFSADGKVLASGDEDGTVGLYDGLTGRETRLWDGHRKWVSGVGFAPDGKTLVSGSADKALNLWDVKSGKLRGTLVGNSAPVTAFAFARDGRRFATAGAVKVNDHEVILWETRTWKAKRVFPDQTMPVASLAFSPDGSTLAIGGGTAFTLGPGTEIGRLKMPGEFKLWDLGGEPAAKK